MGLFSFLKKGKKEEKKTPDKGMPTPPSPPKPASEAKAPVTEAPKEMASEPSVEGPLFPDMPGMEEQGKAEELPLMASEEGFDIPDIMPQKYKEKEAEILKGLEEDIEREARPRGEHKEEIKPPQKPTVIEEKEEEKEDIPEELPELEEGIELPSPDDTEEEVISPELSQEVLRGLEDIEEPDSEIIEDIHAEGPIFITAENYRELKENISDIKNSLKKSDDISENLNKTRTKEDSAFNALHSSLENVERKLIYADKTLFEG